MYSNGYFPAMKSVNQTSSGRWSVDAADFKVNACTVRTYECNILMNCGVRMYVHIFILHCNGS